MKCAEPGIEPRTLLVGLLGVARGDLLAVLRLRLAVADQVPPEVACEGDQTAARGDLGVLLPLLPLGPAGPDGGRELLGEPVLGNEVVLDDDRVEGAHRGSPFGTSRSRTRTIGSLRALSDSTSFWACVPFSAMR